MTQYEKLLQEVAAGKHPTQVVEDMMADRSDDVQDENSKLAAFQQITGTIQNYNGYVGPDWITQIADRVRESDPAGMSDLVSLAQKNRGQYEGSARIDSGGSWTMWDNILKGLLAIRTEQLPPS